MLAAAASSSPSCVDPVDIATSTVLADYKWLPSCRHAAFQAALEQEEGIARVYFAAEVDLAVAVTNSSSSSRGGSTQHGRTTHRSVSLYGMDEDRGILGDDSQPQEQQSVETVRAVVLMTWTALYICDTDATVLRCVPVADVDGVGVIRDTWLWLRIVHPHRTLTLLQEPPLAFGAAANGDGMDTVFRLASENESPLAVQRVFLRVLSAALMHTLAAPSRAPHSSSASSSILTRTTSADFVRFFHDFSLVRLPSRMPSTMTCPPALPLLRYSAVWIDVSNPHSLIEHMLLRHQLVCGRPPPIRYDVLKDPVARWSDAAIEEGRRRQQDPYYSPIPPPITHARSQPALHDARSSASPLRLAESPLPRVSRREGVAPEVPASSCGSNTSPARRRGLPASLPPPSPRSTVNAEVVPPLT
ncbi:hypothetical protein DQ04_00871000, partial [Trypanosoma grayi]|uniref:hypothetical protein n=1 Tax=Trypanosoma grayi TaxID=71804 RepID=UPI0004F4632D